MSDSPHCGPAMYRRLRLSIGILASFTLLSCLLTFFYHGNASVGTSTPRWMTQLDRLNERRPAKGQPQNRLLQEMNATISLEELAKADHPKVGKVSMLYGHYNNIYESAMRTHQRHSEIHNYPTYILREDIVGGYWNKPSYILSLIIAELAKPKEERLEWLMWFDADTVIINPLIPLEPFLPPPDFPDVHYVGSKDLNGLNTGVFFIRVHPWSVNVLTRTLAYSAFHPDVDLGTAADQQAMAILFNQSEFLGSVIYQPRPWLNTFEWHHGYEGKKEDGHLLVHFPGLEEDRWPHMQEWCNRVSSRGNDWERPYENSSYPGWIRNYCEPLREAQSFGRKIEWWLKWGNLEDDVKEAIDPAFQWLRYNSRYSSDETGKLKPLIEEIIKHLPEEVKKQL